MSGEILAIFKSQTEDTEALANSRSVISLNEIYEVLADRYLEKGSYAKKLTACDAENAAYSVDCPQQALHARSQGGAQICLGSVEPIAVQVKGRPLAMKAVRSVVLLL